MNKAAAVPCSSAAPRPAASCSAPRARPPPGSAASMAAWPKGCGPWQGARPAVSIRAMRARNASSAVVQGGGARGEGCGMDENIMGTCPFGKRLPAHCRRCDLPHQSQRRGRRFGDEARRMRRDGKRLRIAVRLNAGRVAVRLNAGRVAARQTTATRMKASRSASARPGLPACGSGNHAPRRAGSPMAARLGRRGSPAGGALPAWPCRHRSGH